MPFRGCACAFGDCLPFLSGAVRVPFGAMLAFFGGRVWLLDCVVDCGVHN